MFAGSKAHKELELLVKAKLLLKDIPSLAPYEQTSALESFHNICCYFAPKSVHFFYANMQAR